MQFQPIRMFWTHPGISKMIDVRLEKQEWERRGGCKGGHRFAIMVQRKRRDVQQRLDASSFRHTRHGRGRGALKHLD